MIPASVPAALATLPPTPAADAPHALTRIVALRRVEIAAQALVLAGAVAGLKMQLPMVTMAAIIALLAAINLVTQWRVERGGAAGPGEIFTQLAVDVAILTLLLYFAGGSANPFVSLFLLSPTLAAAMLPARHAWAMAGLTLAAYTFLMFWNLPLPAPQGHLAQFDALLARATGTAPEHAGHMSGFALHVLGMWLNFVISAGIVVFFLTRMAGALRHREHELAAAREAALRHEQILALGTLAAGAAHKLGTPLGTMAVVIRELELTHAGDGELQEDLGLLRQQVEQCKQTLSQMLASAGQARDDSLQPCPLDRWLADLVDAWQVIRPRARIRLAFAGPQPAPEIAAERTLEQAIVNLLDNAADAADTADTRAAHAEPLRFTATWDADTCRIELVDHGPGLDAEALRHLGQPFHSSKTDTDAFADVVGGLGIGFFLTRATVERFGGRVDLFNREDGPGACTRLTLPLARLKVNRS